MKSQAIKRQRWQFHFYNQWNAIIFRDANWYDFTVFEVSVENSSYMGSCELNLGLLGLNFTGIFRYNYDMVDELDRRVEIIERLQDEHPGAKIEDPLNVLGKLDES